MFESKPFDNLVDLFENRAYSLANQELYHFTDTGLVTNNVAYTYQMMQHRIKKVAALIQRYTQPGDRVLLIFVPGIDYITAFWACLYTGVLAVPTYPPINESSVNTLQGIIDDAAPKLILSNEQIIKNIKRLGLVKALASNGFIKKLMNQFVQTTVQLTEWDFKKFHWLDINQPTTYLEYHPIKIQKQDIAFLQYTSGSTSMPKGVKVSHHNLLANLAMLHETIQPRADDRMVSWLPLYHDMGLIGGIITPVYNKTPIMLMSPLSFLRHPSVWLKAISDFRGTISGGPNFAYELCIKKVAMANNAPDLNLDLSAWRIAYNGAEPVNYLTLESFAKHFSPYGFNKAAYYPLYGLAEATVFVSGTKKSGLFYHLSVNKNALKDNKIELAENVAPEQSQYLVSCGIPSIPVTIVNPNVELCTEGEIGEIWLSGASVTSGYWQNETQTKLNFEATLNHSPNVYLKTGDLGFMFNNHLFITGRIKDLIIINGKNFYPHDIELLVEKSNQHIRLGNTAAVAIKNNEEEVLGIIVELKSSLPFHLYPNIAEDIKRTLLSNLSIGTHCIALLPPKTIPKTTSGKLRRSKAASLLEEDKLNTLYKWQSTL